MKIKKEVFGFFDKQEVNKYILTNTNGIEVEILNYGGTITSIKAPNKNNCLENIVLGHQDFNKYLSDNSYLGAIIGRFGNRIANGKFNLDGKEYNLAKNNAPNNLHGGNKGFDKVIWKACTKIHETSISLKLEYYSKDMEEGFPGNLQTIVTYTLTSDNLLTIFYKAKTDIKTVVNLTNHTYFNLSGNCSKDILNHELQINAKQFLPVNINQIPTSEYRNVNGSPFDFTSFKVIGKDINVNHKQLKYGSGYDHCWVLDTKKVKTLIATVQHKESGRILEVFSNEPGVQFYSGNSLNGDFKERSGFCLETQHFPDSPNQPNFPSVILHPNETYTSETSYKFSVKN
ncbi:MAG: galactose mutarotase [Polaribacter sp.]|nr:galactose mutarotase [Polaribacter sp.]